MDCAGIGSLLVAYHFATLGDEERDAVDAHLLGCTACLRTYLSLKHAAERGPLERPSADVRARLRAEVEEAFRDAGRQATPAPELVNRPARATRVPILARRIPLYQGLVAAALAAAITLIVFGRPGARIEVHEGLPEVDTSRPRAESLGIY